MANVNGDGSYDPSTLAVDEQQPIFFSPLDGWRTECICVFVCVMSSEDV
jgi:hypothetical protein